MKRKQQFLLVALGFWLFYLIASFGMDALWGLNYIHFLSLPIQIALLGLSLLLIIIPDTWIQKLELKSLKTIPSRLLYLLIGLALFWSLGIYENVYGDSVLFMEKMGTSTTQYSSKYFVNLLSLDLTNPKLGTYTILSLVRLISYYFSISHEFAFQAIGLISGLIYLSLGYRYSKVYITSTGGQFIVLALLLLAPCNQLFMGHFEIYAPSFPACALFLISLRAYVKNRKMRHLVWAGVALLFCLKFHFSFVLLLPTFLLAMLLHLKPTWFERKVNWTFILKRLIAPFLAFGTLVYFFVLKDHKDERFLNLSVDVLDRLFLPLFSPEAPLDRYNLLSLNHFLDFFNMFFIWSAAGLFLLVILIAFFRKKINWNTPELILSGLGLVFFVLVYFAFNPLLGMPMDYDLFALISPLFLFFILFAFEQIQSVSFLKITIRPTFAIAFLSLGFFICNANQNSLSLRLESIGKHIFKTYWIRSAGDIQYGLNLIREDQDQYQSRYLALAEELQPYAMQGQDNEYAHVLWEIAKFYRTEKKDYESALYFHLKAKEYMPSMAANYIGLMESSYFLNQYIEAYQYSLKLIEAKYPSEQKAHEIAIDCALQAGLEEEAKGLLNYYLQKWDNPNLSDLRLQLENN